MEKPHFVAFPEAQKANWCSLGKKQLHAQSSQMHSIPLGLSQQAQKANWRSQLHTQSSQMHSIPLGPSENNSFCAKTQRKRDMCDPSGKNPILGHSQRLKKVLLSTQSVCARLRTLPIIMQIPRGYHKKKFIV